MSSVQYILPQPCQGITAKQQPCKRKVLPPNIYCSQHQQTSKAVPVAKVQCQGITLQKTRCKHQALAPSSFCSKHQGGVIIDVRKLPLPVGAASLAAPTGTTVPATPDTAITASADVTATLP